MYDPDKHRRRSIRLKGFDYSLDGGYCITICSHEKKCLFGRIEQGEMQLSELGKIVESEWLKSAEIRKEVILDAYVVMPNHFHAIVYFRRGLELKAQKQCRGVGLNAQKQVESSAQNINEAPASQPEGSGFSSETPTLGMRQNRWARLYRDSKPG